MSKLSETMTAAEFNRRYAIGWPVRFHEPNPHSDHLVFRDGLTTSAAWMEEGRVSGMSYRAMVDIDCASGPVLISDLELIEPCLRCGGTGKIAPIERIGRSDVFAQGSWQDCLDCAKQEGGH